MLAGRLGYCADLRKLLESTVYAATLEGSMELLLFGLVTFAGGLVAGLLGDWMRRRRRARWDREMERRRD